MNKKLIRRGDIWLTKLKESYEFVLKEEHPVVILSNWKACNKSDLIQIVPITSKDKINIPAHVAIGMEYGLDTESTILCEQIQTINKDALLHKIGYCDTNKIDEIQEALNAQLGFTNELKLDVFEEIKEKINDIEELNRYLEKDYSIEIIRERDLIIKCLTKFCLNNKIRLDLSKYTNINILEGVG